MIFDNLIFIAQIFQQYQVQQSIQFLMANNPRKNEQEEIHRELSQKQNKSNLRKGPIECITIDGAEYFYTKCQLAQIKENKTSTIIHNCFLVLYHMNKKYAKGVVLGQSGFPNQDRHPSFYLLRHLSLSRQTIIRYERNCIYLTIDERKQIVFYFDSSKITEEWEKKIINCQTQLGERKIEQNLSERTKRKTKNENSKDQSVLLNRVQENKGQVQQLKNQISRLKQTEKKRQRQMAWLIQAEKKREEQMARLIQVVKKIQGQNTLLKQVVQKREGQISRSKRVVQKIQGQISRLKQVQKKQQGQMNKFRILMKRMEEWKNIFEFSLDDIKEVKKQFPSFLSQKENQSREEEPVIKVLKKVQKPREESEYESFSDPSREQWKMRESKY